MINALRAAGMFFMLAASSVSAGADTLTVDGVERTYLLDGAGDQAKPLIIALHGGGGSAKRFRSSSGLKDAALSEGFTIAWPDSEGGNWNDGRVNRRGQLVSEASDEAFILSLVKELVAKGVADTKHIFVTGHSNGGMMSFALGCKHSRVFKAIAPVSANIPRPMDCKGKGAIAVLNIVGLKDRVVPFEGGGIFGRKRRGELMAANEGFNVLKKRNGCTDGDLISDTSAAGIFTGQSCKAATVQVQIREQGHSWPKSEVPGIVGFFAAQMR
jgi:polyhydroxybutyrate depolymerase